MKRHGGLSLLVCVMALLLVVFCLSPSRAAAHSIHPSDVTHLNATILFEQGVKDAENGNYRQALEHFTQAIQLNNKLASAYTNRCLMQIQLKNYQAAIADCSQSIRLNPLDTEAYLNRGLAFYRQGNYEAAVKENDRLLLYQPNDFRAFFNRGLAKAQMGNHQDAIADYRYVLSHQVELESSVLTEVYTDLGLAHFAMADLPEAIIAFDQAISLEQTNDRAYYNRGCVCGRQGRYWAAIEDFTHSLQLNPDNSEAYLNRGIAHHNLGFRQKALEDLQQAAENFWAQGEEVLYQQVLTLIHEVQQPPEQAVA